MKVTFASSRFTAGLIASLLGATAFGQVRGPSSSRNPYVLPVANNVKTLSILTVLDSVNNKPNGSPYIMCGIPDGMGAFAQDSRTFNLLVNHELPANRGVVRAHGAIGAFVSQWSIERRTLRVIEGHDLIQNTLVGPGGNTFARFCSADLAAPSAYYNPATGLGTQDRIYLNGEEVGLEGRAFAHVVTGPETGNTYELPWLGKYSWENAVAAPAASDKTVVIGLDDTTPGQVYVYIGRKQPNGNAVEKAGLVGGMKYGIQIPGVPFESRDNGLNGVNTFNLAPLGDVHMMSGADLQAASVIAGVTEFARPEDGAWDPNNPNDFYFVTTDRFNQTGAPGRSRLYRLRFNDLRNPETGGQIDMLLDGTEGQQMMDNICVDRLGNVMIVEDVGNNAHLGRVLQYKIATDTLKVLARHDPNLFLTGSPNFLTQDEEASGIIDASDILGRGWYLFDVQAHYAIDGEAVEGGQLVAMFVR